MAKRFRSVRKAAKPIRADSPSAAYHRLRIKCKRFRYAAEFLAEVYPDRTASLVQRLVAVQDILGDHQDSEMAMARLRGLLADHGRDLGPETIFAMGRVAERYAQQITRLRRAFPKAYSKLRKEATSYLRAIDRDRPPMRVRPPVLRTVTAEASTAVRPGPEVAPAPGPTPSSTSG